MSVFDVLNKKYIPESEALYVVTGWRGNRLLCDYVGKNATIVPVRYWTSRGDYGTENACLELVKNLVIYSNREGSYILKKNLDPVTLLEEQYTMGKGGFPYHVRRNYEAVQSFDMFKNKQKVVENVQYEISGYLKYSFGLEFETAQGYVPEHLCFRDGLIPLRDGSLDGGIEYTSVVLRGNDGINLLHQEVKTLSQYTSFNKECALHIHMGGFPMEAAPTWRLYQICKTLERPFKTILPPFTFDTQKYKQHRDHNYCGLLPTWNSFNEMYECLVGKRFKNSFIEPHPNDPDRNRKWQIPTRYYWCNFINFLCYDVNKTIEFRHLRPTYNFNRILLWLYIFNAMLQFAEIASEKDICSWIKGGSYLSQLMNIVYPQALANSLNNGILKQRVLTQNQRNAGDNCGADLSFENILFPEKLTY